MSTMRLGDLLVDSGKITAEQLATAVRRQSGTQRFLGEMLVDLGYASREDIARALARQLGIPFHELGEEFKLDTEEIRLIPESVARKFCLIPVRKNPEPKVTIVMRDPLDLDAVDTVRSLTGLEVHKAISTEERITAVIN